MNKTYCDRCKKEIKDRKDISYVKITSNNPNLHFNLGYVPGFKSHEVCNDCAKEIYEFAKEKLKGGE